MPSPHAVTTASRAFAARLKAPQAVAWVLLLTVAVFLGWNWHRIRTQTAMQRASLGENLRLAQAKAREILARDARCLEAVAARMGAGGQPPQAGKADAERCLAGGVSSLLEVALVDADRQRRWALNRLRDWAFPTALGPEQSQAFAAALSSRKTTYGAARRMFADGDDGRNEPLLDVYVPLPPSAAEPGALVGVHSARGLLKLREFEDLAENHRLSFHHPDGGLIWESPARTATDPTITASLPVGEPGHGWLVRATAYIGQDWLHEENNILGLALGSVLAIGGVMWWLAVIQHRHRKALLRLLSERDKETGFRRAMEESVNTGLRAIDLRGRVTYVNPAFCRMVGWSEAELVGQSPPYAYWPAEELQAHGRNVELILAGKVNPEPFEVKLIRKDGRRFFASFSVTPLVDQAGRRIGWMTACEDITERKEREKLEPIVRVGEVAARLVHDLAQPLVSTHNYCVGCVRLLEGGRQDEGALLAAMSEAAREAQRAIDVLGEIRPLLRSETRPEPTDLGSLINQVIAHEELRMLKNNIAPPAPIPGGLPPVSVVPYLIRSVVTNLLRNAVDAMKDTPAERRRITVWATLAAGGEKIEVAVCDRGSGVPQEKRSAIFEPSYSTKPGGHGFGLFSCRSAVEKHHGRIWVEPNPGGGSIFRFTLPLEKPHDATTVPQA